MRRAAAILLLVSILIPSEAMTMTPDTPARSVERFLARAGLRHARPDATPPAPVALESTRQDWKRLTADRACHTLTPLHIGRKTYRKGLGAHANGTAVFRLDRPFARFVAEVGVDNNTDTGGVRGSVVFLVKADRRELVRTPVCRGGDAPRRLEVALQGARTLELVVTDAGDGYSFDQADWADARVEDPDGRAVYLSDALRATETPTFLSQARLPASFVYGGEPSEKLLAEWPREDRPPVEKDDRRIFEVTWREPGGGLVATWRVEAFTDTDAAELRWTFENVGKAAAKPLTRVLALDLEAAIGPGQARLVHSSGGLTGGMADPDLGFAVSETPLGRVTLAGAGGRSSNRDLPFFLVHDDAQPGGIFVGVGWSGQWQADFAPGENGRLRVTAEMPGMDLALPPGERIVGPSILLGAYPGAPRDGGNALRRLLHDRYAPLLDGRQLLPPVSWNSWFVFDNNIGEEMLKRQADRAAEAGVEYFCIDAGWFEGDFPNGVGNWTLNRAKFPRGLGPVGEHVRAKGMQLGLWFEPERVAANTRLAREHPEWVHGDLLDLGLPAAREWVFRMMKGYLDEGGVRWIRFDFNTDPLAAWETMDAPGARGLSQVRHVMGLYELLDRLRAAYPDLLIEGCASGGRRIDLETVRRSHTFWKSDDTGRLPVMRFHETGGNAFLPGGLLNANLLAFGGDHDALSLFGGPLGFGMDWTRLTAAQQKAVRRLIALYKKLRPLLGRDYDPLFPQRRDESGWTGWQFHDPATGRGFCVVLRPADSPYSTAALRLQGLEPAREYTVNGPLERRGYRTILTGKQMDGEWEVEIPQPGGARLFVYEPAAQKRR